LKKIVSAFIIVYFLVSSFLYLPTYANEISSNYNIYPLYDTSKIITGKAKSNTHVHVFIGSKKSPEVIIAKDGIYRLAIPQQKKGTKIHVKFVEPRGNIVTTKSTFVIDSTIKTESTAYNKINISWSEVPGAKGYEVYQSTSSNGTFRKVGTVSNGNKVSFTKTDVATGKTYYYRIRAYFIREGKKVFGSYSKQGSGQAQLDAPAKLVTKKINITSSVISWSKVPGANGYVVYQSISRNGKYQPVGSVTSGNTVNFTNKDLTINQTYYYKVKAYRNESKQKVYSKESLILTQQIPKFNRKDILLVDKQNGLSKDYVPKNLITPNIRFSTTIPERKKMTKEAGHALEKLFSDAKKAGVVLYAQSGYRSYATQKSIYQYNVNQYGQKKADTFSARPGHSEHQTGLAMDVTSKSINYQLIEKFADTKEGKWIKMNASKYGFIISYPKGKTNITGYVYEPWHIRYVGIEHAQFMDIHKLTLKEYLDKYGK
jgi:LAS superfamily LD-carboxypeptidase LdcB